MADLYKGIAGSPITYLTADISANQTTISIDDDSALPDAPNICTIGYGEHLETIKYETKSNGVLQNVTRGIEGTPRAWPAGTEVARFFTAYDHNSIIENFNSHLADDTKQTLSLSTHWTHSSPTLKYWKDKHGYVHFEGRISTSSEVAGRVSDGLPVGYRPAYELSFAVYGFGSTDVFRCVITPAGQVHIQNTSGGYPNATWYDLSVVYFKAV